MFKQLFIIAAAGMFALSTNAADMSYVKQSILLTDGSIVHIFKDGKMGMEDRFGNAVSMSAGQVMEARDGRRITMVGNEVARTDSALKAQWQQ